VSAHLLEAAVVGAVLADEDRVHGRLHVVVDPARAGAPEEGERLVVGVEDHLPRLARIGPHERHPAVAEADVGDLHRRRHPVDQDGLVAPVELIRFAGVETQRDICRSRRLTLGLHPRGRVAPHGIVANVVTKRPELLENPDAGQPLALRLPGILHQNPVEFSAPRPDLRPRLDPALIGELGHAGSHHFPYGLPRHPQLATDLLDRLPVLKVRPSDLRDRFHHQHPEHGSRLSTEARWTTASGGARLEADHPDTGSFFHACSQPVLRQRVGNV
jgi:hypothetical protein